MKSRAHNSPTSDFFEEFNMGKLEGKIALVTGGATGIGFASAQIFAEEGARVFITGRRQAELDAAAAAIGSNATAIQCDISKLAELDRLYARISDEAGRLDIVFANAGGGEFARLGEISEEHFDATFATNVKGTLFTVQNALPLMRQGGSIVVTSSTTGTTGTENFSVYSGSKAAVRNFVRSWILDLKGTGIRVNVLSPGATETPGLTGLVPSEHEQGLLDQLATTIPLGRVGQPREVAQAALFLASDDSSFVNGIELFADGGSAQV
jgi:NAD(P)-dependent dehydrogenase (short-subunit alcohol dehydrogenase family)